MTKFSKSYATNFKIFLVKKNFLFSTFRKCGMQYFKFHDMLNHSRAVSPWDPWGPWARRPRGGAGRHAASRLPGLRACGPAAHRHRATPRRDSRRPLRRALGFEAPPATRPAPPTAAWCPHAQTQRVTRRDPRCRAESLFVLIPVASGADTAGPGGWKNETKHQR